MTHLRCHSLHQGDLDQSPQQGVHVNWLPWFDNGLSSRKAHPSSTLRVVHSEPWPVMGGSSSWQTPSGSPLCSWSSTSFCLLPDLAALGPLTVAAFLACLVVGLLNESIEVCLVLPTSAIGLLRLGANMQSTSGYVSQGAGEDCRGGVRWKVGCGHRCNAVVNAEGEQAEEKRRKTNYTHQGWWLECKFPLEKP